MPDDKPKNLLKFKLEVSECSHMSIHIDESKSTIYCAQCKREINPVWWIKRIAVELKDLQNTAEYWGDVIDANKAKSKTKCKHCQKMTPINLSRPIPWEYQNATPKT